MNKQDKSHSKDFKSLNEWLCYLETIHNTEIDLGLSRISQVAKRLNINFSFARVITVAGTNGKGTTCAFLENALLDEKRDDESQQCLKVAVYSSPHIERFNERLRINKCDIDDHSLIKAFKEIEIARADISLSYYEFTTLAAFLVLMDIKPDVIILEVGLGGRLDATNIIDADVAVITSVDLDHQAFLGNDRETIGFEKAGIMRKNQHIIIGDPSVPNSVLNHAIKVNETFLATEKCHALSKIKVRNRDFFSSELATSNNTDEEGWQWHYSETTENGDSSEFYLDKLHQTHIPQDNVITALMVLKQLKVSLTSSKVNQLIEKTKVAGRTELFRVSEVENNSIKLQCDVMLDVGHNPHAGRYLAATLEQYKVRYQYNKIIAVVAMLADKDIANTLSPFKDIIDVWHIAPLNVPRAATSEQLSNVVLPLTKSINCFDNITQAFKMANLKAESTDLILVFGSFYTVAEIRQLLI